MKHAISTSYNPPEDPSGVTALDHLNAWIEGGLKLEEGKYGLGFPYMYLLLTGSAGIKARYRPLASASRDGRVSLGASRVGSSFESVPLERARDLSPGTGAAVFIGLLSRPPRDVTRRVEG